MTTSTPPTMTDAGLRRPWLPGGPRSSLERGQLAVLIVLALLTIGAWALTIQQAQTMDMPMGVVARDRDARLGHDAPAAMDDMGGMAMDEAGDDGRHAGWPASGGRSLRSPPLSSPGR